MKNVATDNYAAEARDRWGGTDAYRQSEQRTAGYSTEDQQRLTAAMDALIAEFAACRKSGHSPADAAAQELVRRWQEFISRHYYTCTDEILAGLGAMYVCDRRFTDSIDRHGEGTARFMSEAIKAYCS